MLLRCVRVHPVAITSMAGFPNFPCACAPVPRPQDSWSESMGFREGSFRQRNPMQDRLKHGVCSPTPGSPGSAHTSRFGQSTPPPHSMRSNLGRSVLQVAADRATVMEQGSVEPSSERRARMGLSVLAAADALPFDSP